MRCLFAAQQAPNLAGSEEISFKLDLLPSLEAVSGTESPKRAIDGRRGPPGVPRGRGAEQPEGEHEETVAWEHGVRREQ